MFDVLRAYAPAIVFGGLFVRSYLREPRQFRNALYLLAAVGCALVSSIVMLRNQIWLILLVVALIVLFPLLASVLLIMNGVIVLRREGLSLASLLPILLAVFIVALYVSFPLTVDFNGPRWLMAIAGLFVFEGLWFSFTLVALLLYSWLYRTLPRKRVYDYIIIHGAGLSGDRPTPLLAGRLDKGIELWRRQDKRGRIVVSGGQGADEVVSEAAAMHAYLVRNGVPAEAILDEDRSTTTMENLRYSRDLIDSLAQGSPYRCVVVTSDFHVFRCVEYAHKLGIAADGVGSKTSGWYWPTAFIREFVAITKAHPSPYIGIAILWALANLIR